MCIAEEKLQLIYFLWSCRRVAEYDDDASDQLQYPEGWLQAVYEAAEIICETLDFLKAPSSRPALSSSLRGFLLLFLFAS